jgi:hypothetical protein
MYANSGAPRDAEGGRSASKKSRFSKSKSKKARGRVPNVIPESEFQRVLGPERHELLKKKDMERRARGEVHASVTQEQPAASEYTEHTQEDSLVGSVGTNIVHSQDAGVDGDAASVQREVGQTDGSTTSTVEGGSGGNRQKSQRVWELRDLESEPSSKFAKYRNEKGEINLDAYTLDMYKNVKEVLDLGNRHVDMAFKERGINPNPAAQAKTMTAQKKAARRYTKKLIRS